MIKSLFTIMVSLTVSMASAHQVNPISDPFQTVNNIEGQKEFLRNAPAKQSLDSPQLIIDPQGTTENYTESGNGIFYFLGIMPVQEEFSNYPTHLVYGEDCKVYIYNIIPRFPTESYVEGKLEENKIIVSFPQAVHIEKREGNIYNYYVDRIEREFVDDNQVTYWPSKKRDVIYNILTDGTIEMEKSSGEWAIGITNEDGLWQGYADWDCVYSPNSHQLIEAPSDIVTEKMQMITNYTGYDIHVGIKDNEVYIKGICPTCPDSWVKGNLDGDKVTFQNGQYLGVVPGYNQMGFFFGGMAYPDPKWVWAYELSDKFEMKYDSENKTFTTDQTIIINDNENTLHYMHTFRVPLIHPNKEDHSPVPMNPAPISYQPYGFSGNCIGFKFYLPNLSVDKYVIPKDEIFWSLYIDDELYTFEPYLFEGLKKDMTEVPYNCDLEDIDNEGETVIHTIYIPIEDFQKVGYISIHKLPGVEDPYYSDLVEFDNPDKNSVDNLLEHQNSEEAIFDLNGLRIDRPVKGHIYIIDKGSKKIKRIY